MSQRFYVSQDDNNEIKSVTKQEYQDIHSRRYQEADESQKKQATIDYFGGMRSESNTVLPEVQQIHKAASKSKNANAKALKKTEQNFSEEADKYAAKALGKSGLDRSCVKGISAFFTGNKAYDREMIRAYLNRTREPQTILEACIEKFSELSLENIDISSEKKLIGKSSFLEKVSSQYDAVVRLIAENREAYDALPEEIRDNFENKIGQANGLVNYYRLMKKLMTDSYYISNDVSNILNENPKEDTPDKRRVRNLLFHIHNGFAALRNQGLNIMNRHLDRMVGTLSLSVVDSGSLDLSKDLLDRRSKMGDLSISQYLNQLELKGNAEGFANTPSKGIYERAKNSISLLDLPDSVDDAIKNISSILNQLDFVKSLKEERDSHRNFFYLENDYRDIALMEEVVKLGGPLGDLKRTILTRGGISEDGALEKAKLSASQRKDLQKDYQDALTRYREIFDSINDYRSDMYFTPPEDADEMTAAFAQRQEYVNKTAGERAKTKYPSQEVRDALREELRVLYGTLSESEYSDYSIYANAPKILELSVKCQAFLAAPERERLESLVYLASELRIKRKLKDLDKALKCNSVSDEDRAALLEEKEKFEAYEKDVVKVNDEKTSENQELQLKLRNEAQKTKYETEDFRAEASTYLFQEQWIENTYRKKDPFSFGNIMGYVMSKIHIGLTRLGGWFYSRPRTTHHGAELYDSSKRDLTRIPPQLKHFGEDNDDLSITQGDGTYAPKIELNKYFKDPMKIRLYNDYKEISALMKGGEDYPQSMKDAAEALDCYCQVRGIVNRDTYDMEQAFLDKFNKSVEQMFIDEENTARFPQLKEKIHNAYKHYADLSCGTLSRHMNKGELEAVKETTAFYTKKTYFGDSEESNMMHLPLFPHSPNLNDIKQGVLGNCYMVAAVQTILASDPQAIRDMFHDLGDGNVIVRFYAAYGEVEINGKKSYTRIDDPEAMAGATMRPVYVKVKKHYETGEEGSCDCMWMQLLEKAYAAAGFNHGNPDIDKNGELHNLNAELNDGRPDEALLHLTGKMHHLKDLMYIAPDGYLKPAAIKRSTSLTNYKKRVLLRNVPAYLHNAIYAELTADNKVIADYEQNVESENEFIKQAVKAALDDIKFMYDISGLGKSFEELVKKGKITEKQKEELLTELDSYTDNTPQRVELISKLITGNMNSDQILQDTSPLQDAQPIFIITSELQKEVVKPDVTYAKLMETILKTDSYYERNENDEEVSEEAKRQMKVNLKTFLVPDKKGLYTPVELGYLKHILKEIRQGRPVPMVYNGGHVMTALDVKLHNDKWFVLMRDPFNIEHAEYSVKEDAENEAGEVEKKFSGLSEVIDRHLDIRELSDDVESGFMGMSWWELKDVTSMFVDFSIPA